MFNLIDTIEDLRNFLNATLANYGIKQKDLEEIIAANIIDGKVIMIPTVKAVRKLIISTEYEKMAETLQNHGYSVTYMGGEPPSLMCLREAVWLVKTYLMLMAISPSNIR